MEGEVLEVHQFIPSTHEPFKQFGFSFTYDAPRYGMSCRMASGFFHISSIFSKEPETLYLHKSLPTVQGFIVFFESKIVENKLKIQMTR